MSPLVHFCVLLLPVDVQFLFPESSLVTTNVELETKGRRWYSIV